MRPINELSVPHWRFALDAYAQPDAAAACLLLQDEYGVDVDVLLMTLYAAAIGAGVPTEPWLAAVDASIDELRGNAIAPLRGVRRAMKVMSPPIQQNDWSAIRNQVKALEIELEQIEQHVIAAQLPTPNGAAPDFKSSVGIVIDFYARWARIPVCSRSSIDRAAEVLSKAAAAVQI